MENKNLKMKPQISLLIIGVVALVLGGTAGFFGGMQYQKTQTGNKTFQFTNGTFQGKNITGGRMINNGTNGIAIRGQIISSDNNSITVKLQDSSTKIIILGSSTTIGKTTTGSAADLTNGSEITAFGTTNSDGTVTATNVQIGNVGMFGVRPSGNPQGSPIPQ